MKTGRFLRGVACGGLVLLPLEMINADDSSGLWAVRLDAGGTIPQDTSLTELGGPVTGQKFKLEPGFKLDVSGGYRLTPWLEVGPELGFTFNSVREFGRWSYPDTTLGQILLMANVRVEYPYQHRLVPVVGAGIGGVASFLTFGGGSGYYYEPDGTGNDFSLGVQAFGGLRYRMSDSASLGVEYRYLLTDRQHWSVDWWYGDGFDVEVNRIQMHSVCLVFTAEFW